MTSSMAVKEHEWELTDETATKSLDGILARLEQNLSDDDYAQRLRRSPYERSKASANLEYARTLLFRVERVNKNPETSRTTKQTAQNMAHQRSVLKACEDRLDELNQAASTNKKQAELDSSDADEDDEDMQDILRRFAPARANISSGIDTEQDETPQATKDAQTHAAAAQFTSTLRSRRPGAEAATASSTATTTSSSATPFPARPASSAASTTETLLTSHTLTQEDLTTSLLDLARALNKSTQSFSSALEASNPLVDNATSALDKNVGGMESAERRMGMLRKMTEGKGFFARLTLWAWVGIGWAVLLVVMFIMPKLRF